MSIPDKLLWNYFELLTDLPAADIAKRKKSIEEGGNPRDVKAELARTITGQFHGKDAAARAEEDFRRAFSKGELPSDIETQEISRAEPGAARVLVAAGLASSMREARRKIAEGALQLYDAASMSGSQAPQVLRDPDARLDTSGAQVIRLGRQFRRIVWK